jgi:beta-phosphoglucomutase
MSSQYCVIFDMDGVLADTGEVHLKSWQKLAEELDVEFEREFFEKTFGQTSVKILKKLIGEDVEEDKLKEWSERKEQYYREMVKDELEPLPGVKELIVDLYNNGFKLAVGSSGPRENINLLLETLNIKSYFDLIVSAEDVENGKPNPEVFLQVSKKLDLNTRNCAVIEDAPVGIKAARRAGMKTIALTTTHSRKELKDADLIIPDLSAIDLDDIYELILTV